ncbi:MAG: hypothetical protein M1823_002197 [Watsoniomyces obsoletus]|nr:MAG: hypothetical protein M1823_002197 [Watsoniomyces obsoletus]
MAYSGHYDAPPDPRAYYDYPPPHVSAPPHAPPYPEPYDTRARTFPVMMPDTQRSEYAHLPTSPPPRHDSVGSGNTTMLDARTHEREGSTSSARPENIPLGRPRATSSVRHEPGRSELPRGVAPPPRSTNEPAPGGVTTAASPESSTFSTTQIAMIAEIVNQALDGRDKTMIAEIVNQVLDGRDKNAAAAEKTSATTTSNVSAAATLPKSTLHDPPSPPAQTDQRTSTSPVRLPAPPASSTTHKREPSVVRHGQRPVEVHDTNSRPSIARELTNTEETPLDKTWGQLFDAEGNATCRLGQLLRGLANHIVSGVRPSLHAFGYVSDAHAQIQNFHPANSIVVTPVKMAKYYETYRLSSEPWPWDYYFKTLSCPDLSRLYQDLGCQHHLVQDQRDDAPTIPGLTPVGFERWMTLLILANPDEEVERLQKAVLGLPVSNADDPKERFPKEISRRLFPKHVDPKARARVRKVLSVDGRDVPVAAASESVRQSPPPSSTTTSATTHVPPPPPPPSSDRERERERERERSTYSTSSSEITNDDISGRPPAIERERQPYVARPGGGKDFELPDSKASSTTSSTLAPDRATGGSTRAAARPVSMASGGNLEIPTSGDGYHHHHQRANSTTAGIHPSSTRRKGRSPSISNSVGSGGGGGGGGGGDFRRSDNDLSLGGNSGGVYGGDVMMDDDRRRRFVLEGEGKRQGQGQGHEWARRVPVVDDEYVVSRERDRDRDRDWERERERDRRGGGYEEDYYR